MARFIALDWDNKQLNIVSANVGKNGIQLQKAVSFQEEQSPNLAEAEALGNLLRDRLKSSGIAPAPVLISVGRDRVIVKDVRYPPVPAAEEPALVRFQAVKEITDAPEDVVIDYTVVGEGSGDRRAMALILRRELLNTYSAICKAAGLKLAGVTPRPFGILACLDQAVGKAVMTSDPDHADSALAVLTLSDTWAEFCVARNGTLMLARSIPVAGNLSGEVRRNLSVHAGQSPKNPIRALFVAGKEEQQNALRLSLGDSIGLPVYSLDPFGELERPDLPAKGRSAFTGAVGLLHLQASLGEMPINFAHPKEPKPPKDPNRLRIIAAAAVAAVLLVAAGVYGYLAISAKDAQIDKLGIQQTALKKQLEVLEEDAKRIKAIGDWTGTEVVWLDELYDMTDRFPDVTNIRLTSLTADPIAKSAKETHVARMAVKGITQDRAAIDTLLGRLVQEGQPEKSYYRVDAPHVAPNTGVDRFRFTQQFNTKVDIESRPPEKYIRHLVVPDAPAPGRGGRGGPGRGGMPGMGIDIFGGDLP